MKTSWFALLSGIFLFSSATMAQPRGPDAGVQPVPNDRTGGAGGSATSTTTVTATGNQAAQIASMLQVCLSECRRLMPTAFGQICGAAGTPANPGLCLGSQIPACVAARNITVAGNVVLSGMCGGTMNLAALPVRPVTPPSPPVDRHPICARNCQDEAAGPVRDACLSCCLRRGQWAPIATDVIARQAQISFAQISGRPEEQLRCTSAGQATLVDVVGRLATRVLDTGTTVATLQQTVTGLESRVATLQQASPTANGGTAVAGLSNDLMLNVVATLARNQLLRRRSEIDDRMQRCTMNAQVHTLQLQAANLPTSANFCDCIALRARSDAEVGQYCAYICHRGPRPDQATMAAASLYDRINCEQTREEREELDQITREIEQLDHQIHSSPTALLEQMQAMMNACPTGSEASPACQEQRTQLANVLQRLNAPTTRADVLSRALAEQQQQRHNAPPQVANTVPNNDEVPAVPVDPPTTGTN